MSWAVPRGPSTDPRDKRLAVRVWDHSLDHAGFEGCTGTATDIGDAVLLWDSGRYRNIRVDRAGAPIPMRHAIDDGKLEVWLTGHKLRGGYSLFRMRTREIQGNWLLIKKCDAGADAGRDPVRTEPHSVLTGRTLEEISGTIGR